MKFKLLMALLFGSLFSMYAQNNGSVSGKVIDSRTGETIPYVTIGLKDNGTLVTGGITDDNGVFNIKELPLKTLTVEIQFIGYTTKTLTADLSAGNRSVDLGTISIVEDVTELDAVEIVTETSTIEQKLDRKVITVGRDLTTAGGTAAEIMNNIPSVNVDQDGNISLRGNQNVRILVDGRPTNIDPAQLLRQIPSTSIKKIELITNPSAKYNPEGMSGIINIILHKNANDGFNGSFNAGVNFGETPKFNNSLDMNYRVGKVNFFTNVGSNFGQRFNGGEVNRRDIGSRQEVDVMNDTQSFLGKIGMDFYINDKNTISVYTNQNYSDGTAIIDTWNIYPPALGEDNIFQHSDLEEDGFNNSYNLAYRRKFEKEGHTLDFEANYNDSEEKQDVVYETNIGANPTEFYYDELLDTRKNTTVNLDYVNPLSEKSTLELGAEARIIRTDNDYLTTNPLIDIAERDVVYTYDMDIYSAYATFGQKFEKFSYQLGARLESYKVAADFNNGQASFKDDYITVYPSAYLNYNLNEKNMLQLSFSRRVDRPSVEQTKLIREFSTPLLTSYGNPELRPQFTSSVELNYTKMFGQGSSITGGIFYRFINDEISRIFYPNETTERDDDQIMSFGNFDDNSAYGFEVSANYKIAKWWDIQPAIDFSGISQKGLVAVRTPGTDNFEFVQKEVDVNAFNARINSNWRVNKRLSFLLFGFLPRTGKQCTSQEP
jgi:outer membrane receptor protein involved in Fe transport